MGAQILIIEDNAVNLELMTSLLGAIGHSILYAEDGQRGLKAARFDHPDLIICNVHLSHTDGFEIARRLKSDPQLHTTPLLAITALAMAGDRDRVLGAGFDGYLAKPIDADVFVRQMEVFLRPGRYTSPARQTQPVPAGN